MLRASMEQDGIDYDLTALTGKTRGDGGIPHAQLLADFGEAIVLKDAERTAQLRDEVVAAVGEAGMIDAVGVAAAFHGNVRVADATGAAPPVRGGEEATKALRENLGINDFFTAQNH